MPDDDAARGFDRFHRADTSRPERRAARASVCRSSPRSWPPTTALSRCRSVARRRHHRHRFAIPDRGGDAVNDVVWYLSRATGIVAAVLAVAALAWGFLFSARETGTRDRPAWWLDLHNWLGGLALIFTIAHIVDRPTSTATPV